MTQTLFSYFYAHRMIFPTYFSDMRRDVQEIFRNTPHEKQVCMFSATLSKEIRPVCKKFMQDVGNYDRNYYWGKVK